MPVYEYVLIDASDGEEHDRYDQMVPALTDAYIRAGWKHQTVEFSKVVTGFDRKATFTGPHGKWIVKRERVA